jgi:hypothetical protein
MTVDDEYCNLSKQRNISAATKTRTVRAYEDNRDNHMALVASKRASDLATKRKVIAICKLDCDEMTNIRAELMYFPYPGAIVS